jgi:predicted transcriptional regulator of viral defense system
MDPSWACFYTTWILWRLCKNGLGQRATFLMDQMDEKNNARRPKNDNRKENCDNTLW